MARGMANAAAAHALGGPTLGDARACVDCLCDMCWHVGCVMCFPYTSYPSVDCLSLLFVFASKVSSKGVFKLLLLEF